MTILASSNTSTLGFGLGGIIRTIGGIAGKVAGTLLPGPIGDIAEALIPGGPCPAGTACSGPTVLGQCLGSCRAFGQPGGGDDRFGGGEQPCPAGMELAPGPGGRLQCVDQGSQFPTGGGGTALVPTSQCGVCATPGGQKGRMVKEVVKGVAITRCKATRRMNPGNFKAARRARTRLGGAVKELRKIEALVKDIPITKSTRRRAAPRRKAGCGCG